MRRVLAALGAMAVAGCASSGPTGSEVLTGSLQPTVARLVMYRTSALGMAVQPSYVVDGVPTVASTPNGFLVCDLKPGRHDVAVAHVQLNVNVFGGSDKASLDLAPGTTTYVQAQPQPGLTIGILTLIQVTEAQGRADTTALHKLEGGCQKA
jgi:hypothetical protein